MISGQSEQLFIWSRLILKQRLDAGMNYCSIVKILIQVEKLGGLSKGKQEQLTPKLTDPLHPWILPLLISQLHCALNWMIKNHFHSKGAF